LTFPEGGVNPLLQFLALQRVEDPHLLVEWSDIIEKKASENCRDSLASIRFKGYVNDQNKFVLDLDASGPDATLCLLQAIESCLDLMPTVAKKFYAALMDALATDAEKRDGMERGS
jgi:hypothetical protein